MLRNKTQRPSCTERNGDIVIQLKRDDRSLTGLEAAIILIAVVVVTAIILYMAFGAGSFPFKSGAGTCCPGPAGTLQLSGNVYGLATEPASGINEIRFSVHLAPDAPAMDLTTMTILFSTPITTPVVLSHGTAASKTVFTTRLNGAGEAVSSITPGQQVEIDFLVENVSAGTRMNFDVRPPAGSLSFSRTAPGTITNTTIL